MDHSIKTKKVFEFVCKDCQNKHQITGENFEDDNKEELFCLYCIQLNVQNHAKCLYKGNPSCYNCAVSSHKLIQNEFDLQNKSIKSAYNRSKGRNSLKILHESDRFFHTAEKNLVNSSLIQTTDEPHREFTNSSSNYSSLNSNISNSNPFSSITPKSLFQIVSSSSSTLSSRRNLNKNPFHRLTTAVESIFMCQPFNFKDIFYPLIYEVEKNKKIENSRPKFLKGNFVILFLNKSNNCVYGSIISINYPTTKLSKIFKVISTNNQSEIIYYEFTFENFTISDRQITFSEGSYFDLLKFEFISNISKFNFFLDKEDPVISIKIYEIF